MRSAILLLWTVSWPLHHADAAPRLGVVVIGDDVARVGEFQDVLEKALGSGGAVRPVPARELALRFAIPIERSTDETLAALLVEAREAYFDDRLDDLETRLATAAKIVDAGLGRPRADRLTILTWQAALRLAKGDRVSAYEAARLAIAIAPGYEPDLAVFRPSVATLFEEARRLSPPPVGVRLEGVPDGASVELDGHFVSRSFRTSPGPHKVRVRGVGFRPASLLIDATPDLVVKVSPALDISGPTAQAIEWAVWSEMPAPSFADLVSRAGADHLLLVAVRPDGSARALLCSRGAPAERSGRVAEGGAPELARWVEQRLRPSAPSWQLATSVRGLSAVNRSSVAFVNGERFETEFGGAGAGVSSQAARGRLRLTIGAALVSFSRSRARFQTDDGAYDVAGGTLLELSGAGSWGFSTAGLEIRPEVALRFERNSSGGPRSFAVLPAYERSDAVAAVALESGPGATARLGTRLSVSQNLGWRGLNGWGRASHSPGFEGQIFLGRSGARWLALVEYRAFVRSARFEGAYAVSSSPALEDAEVRETAHAVGLVLSRRW